MQGETKQTKHTNPEIRSSLKTDTTDKVNKPHALARVRSTT
jgi:hypothetical protein